MKDWLVAMPAIQFRGEGWLDCCVLSVSAMVPSGSHASGCCGVFFLVSFCFLFFFVEKLELDAV